MPGSGPVYQPTTVSYETRPGTGAGGGLLAQTTAASSLKMLRKPAAQMAVLVFGLISLAAGIVMIASGSADYSDTEQHPETHPDDGSTTPEERLDIGLIVAGVFVTILGFVLLGLYIKVAEWRRNCVCPCTFSKKQSLARQLQGNSCGGQILALNPSTDPLVSHTQYAPVSEIPQEEERRNLMPDSKDSCLSSAEESDRMLDPDPRIVLRPIGNSVEDA
uniref:Putative secreted protein n=2 Tax=Culex tarsalis TaxID=7177 RepID=A0A1Q3FXS7_CULTA